MRNIAACGIAFALAAFCITVPAAQSRFVAITFDDLPYRSVGLAGAPLTREAIESNRRILAALTLHHVPVTGFVIETHVDLIGRSEGIEVLRQWVHRGLELGNHTYSHADFDLLTAAEFKNEIVKGEATFASVMRAAGKESRFFRFPMNHTGDTKAKHDEVAGFLAQRGYKLATCTIDTSDYLFNKAYAHALARHDDAAAKKLSAEYLRYTDTEIDYYAALNRKVLGYEPPEVMLLHDNRLNADVLEQVLRLFENKGYTFVTLEQAQLDPAYSAPETYITKYGPMWGYRWAAERGVKVNGRLETEVPQWVEAYAADQQ
ncbi:MAG TPA: polysaccharide deacetylase family protein [Bryobacteraceae bacterium]|nr:polysaccharide deacetylase family protein [Bryobacteraceae bacterium]